MNRVIVSLPLYSYLDAPTPYFKAPLQHILPGHDTPCTSPRVLQLIRPAMGYIPKEEQWSSLNFITVTILIIISILSRL